MEPSCEAIFAVLEAHMQGRAFLLSHHIIRQVVEVKGCLCVDLPVFRAL